MKVALCISGEMRTFQKKVAYWKSFCEFFDTDIFISTWSKVGYDERRINTKHSNMNDSVSFDYLKSFYENLKVANIYRFQKIFSYKIGDVEMPANRRNKENKYLIPMYYLIYDCNNLRKKYENDNNIKYDIIIRTRPDKGQFHQNYKKVNKILKRFEILWYLPKSNGLISDKFALSCGSNMDFYSNIFLNLNEYFRNPKLKIGAELLLNYHLKKAPFTTKPL